MHTNWLVVIESAGVQPRFKANQFSYENLYVTAKKLPADCATKKDVRDELDRIDSELVTFFAERHSYVTRMAELKEDPHEAVVPERIEAVIKKVRAQAGDLHMDEDQAELIWRTLINWNINYEKGIIAARHRS